jgi:hypothetical protein
MKTGPRLMVGHGMKTQSVQIYTFQRRVQEKKRPFEKNGTVMGAEVQRRQGRQAIAGYHSDPNGLLSLVATLCEELNDA